MRRLFTFHPRPGVAIWGALALALILAVGAGLRAGPDPSRAGTEHPIIPAGRPAPVAAPAEASPFITVAELVLPAVVSVDVRRTIQHPDIDTDSLEGFVWPFDRDGELEIPSSGSGFVFAENGYILTNAHVVSGASEIVVHFYDGRQIGARLVGSDPATDVAVLSIQSDGPLPTVRLGNSDSLQIGEWVAAVGNPLGVLQGSVTVGVVSAKARNEISIGGSTPSYQDFIQTDAAINFGNSGGPLVNARGEAVGMNTAFSGPGRGLGFAVSINLAREVAESLLQDGRVQRGYLGVVLQRIDPMLAEALGLPDPNGVLIRDVQNDTPASRAGMRPGDAVVAFAGDPVRDLSSFRLQVARTPSGRRVPVQVFRSGQTLSLEVELAARPDLDGSASPPGVAPAEPTFELGLDLTEPEREDGDEQNGALVRGVQAGSVGSLGGLRPLDVILEVGGARVRNVEHCESLLQSARQTSRPVLLTVRRSGERWYLALPPRR